MSSGQLSKRNKARSKSGSETSAVSVSVKPLHAADDNRSTKRAKSGNRASGVICAMTMPGSQRNVVGFFSISWNGHGPRCPPGQPSRQAFRLRRRGGCAMNAEVIVKAPGSELGKDRLYRDGEPSGCSPTEWRRRRWPSLGRSARPALCSMACTASTSRATASRHHLQGGGSRYQVDRIAWQRTAGKLASCAGCTFCLGDLNQLYIRRPISWAARFAFPPTPLDWLRATREGIVICAP